ncbi:hypothetical protein ACFE04_017652 [Oxalis oulophora]
MIANSVAVAVNGRLGGEVGSGSRRALRWAVEKFSTVDDRFILVHVMPRVTCVPTPCKPAIYCLNLQEVKMKFEEVFVPLKRQLKIQKMEILVLEDENPADALVNYISDSRVKSLVMGSCNSHWMTRRLKGPGVPTTVATCAPETCDIYIVSKNQIVKKAANPTSSLGNSPAQWFFTRRNSSEGSSAICRPSAPRHHRQSTGMASISEDSFLGDYISTYSDSPVHAVIDNENKIQNMGGSIESVVDLRPDDTASIKTEQSDLTDELEILRLELQNTVNMHRRTCEELVHAQNKIQRLSSECLEEARKVNAATERESTLRKLAAEEKAKYLQTLKEIEGAKKLLAEEVYKKQMAELNAFKESIEKQKLVDEVLVNDRRYRRFTTDEIEAATDFFSESNMIGEGGYGKVYKCSLDRTPVAVKVLHESRDGKVEFLREVEVLSQLRHPHIISLIGACPETRTLVYEYMENGSLEDYIFHRDGKSPLPWFIRFQIIFEVASGLAFLHNSKPEPIVHRDLKPGNILLDRNHVSKIGDVGLARLISEIVPDNVTEYRDTVIAGTFHYLDPEYQRTGVVRPKSDVYAFGVIILQLLTGRNPNGLLYAVENCIDDGLVTSILDKSVTDWPLVEAEEMVRIAIKCSNLRCRDRPDLDTEVLPVLKRLADFANAANLGRSNVDTPRHYFCPILQEIMEDPYIATDGFTYEYRAIKTWLERQSVSPVTKLQLQDAILTPNHTLRSAIQEWRSRAIG